MGQRTQYLCAASADGYIADADGGLEWLFASADGPTGPDDEDGSFDGFLRSVGALAMGAATYEFLLGERAAWPHADLPGWVFTHRDLPAIEGADLRFVEGRPRDHHADMLAAAGGRNVWMMGGGRLASDFADDGLLDELIVSLVPVVLGTGVPLFARPLPRPMRLERARTLSRGLVELRYSLT